MAIMPPRLLPGQPDPLGATWDGLGINFAVFSANADRIELCIFDRGGRREIARYDLPDCTDEVFHGYLPDALPGLIYGYRAHGPYQPERGHRFNPNKLLLDPYARALFGQLHWSDTLFGYRVGAARVDLSFDRRDSALAMPKSIVVGDSAAWGDHRRPNRGWSETVIYEAHLRGFTKLNEDIPERRRGTFAALQEPRVIDHLRALGITAIEFLPIQAYLQDRFLIERKLCNYWGYSTLGFFAPEPTYLADAEQGGNEVRAAVRRLHEAGIEIILDVVYNHTCEGNEMGPTLSWRGLDNASYYRLFPGHERHFINDTGCGNTLNITHPRVLQMVMDSLRYWATAYQVDGFRFDLGTILGRETGGFDPGAGFFDAIRQDPLLSRLKLISEPWDIGPGGYQLGNHPPGFAEWNGEFRDGVRRFWRGDAGQRPEIARRLMGSPELFDRRRRKPFASINFLTAHDGFTLHDLVSYAETHNFENGENNQDGHSDNISANWGIEGETDNPEINAIRDRFKRALLATLFVSYGTPMLLGGDEMNRTQRGNNNAYCQNNGISWFDWSVLKDGSAVELARLVGTLTALRQRYPSLRSAVFRHGLETITPGIMDTAWFDEQANELTSETWTDPAARLLALRRATKESECPDVTLLLLNASEEDRNFILPEPVLNWTLEADTANPKIERSRFGSNEIMVVSRSMVVLGAIIEENT
ncbi:glycogen debranching protein GlgX [Acidiphilium sp. AL]|uniref:glycogen debranching protein GlgX n=1 Tax=Acidiphilium sp. AL TaxID=2871704 RepID=UPI0021CB8F60|nr:glycogen debranching protein GlgX [Acidiphilium sp. AL]MCU4158504.1 glycogen debranching protein GlgX [Acidiphilium sp. AL]